MPLDATSIFGLLSARASWAGRRLAVLADNLANADTPGRRSQDLLPFEELLGRRARAAPPLLRTDPRHLAVAGSRRPSGARPAESWETAPAGNAVVIEEQMQKIASTQLDYRLALDLYGKQLGMLRTALGIGQ